MVLRAMTQSPRAYSKEHIFVCTYLAGILAQNTKGIADEIVSPPSPPPDIVQENMTMLTAELEYVLSFINDLLVIMHGTFGDQTKSISCTISTVFKYNFGLHTHKYLEHTLRHKTTKCSPVI